MKTMHIIVVCTLLLLYSCKENKESAKPVVEEPKQEIIVADPIPKEITELLKFADTSLSESTELNQLLNFKKLDTSGIVQTIDNKEAVSIYKKMMTIKNAGDNPIFEIKNTDRAILVLGETGYSGPIWAKILMDSKEKEILKIQFEHKLESDIYGAGITSTSFENQFLGTKINQKVNLFGLQQNGRTVEKGNLIIDGISGATVTSRKVVEMMNKGLRRYSNIE